MVSISKALDFLVTLGRRGAGTHRVGRVRHRVERTDLERELVNDVVVGVVLGLDDLAERLLTRGTHVVVVADRLRRRPLLDARLLQELDRVAVLEDERLGQPGKVVVRELTAHDVNLLRVALLQAGKDVLEHAVDRLHDLVVVLLERHLEIESHELGQVTVRVRVFGTEHGSDLVDLLHVAGNAHLLVQLRRLGKERDTCERSGRNQISTGNHRRAAKCTST